MKTKEEKIRHIISTCKFGVAKKLPASFKLDFSTVNKTRIRAHLRTKCAMDISAVAFNKLETLQDLLDLAGSRKPRR